MSRPTVKTTRRLCKRKPWTHSHRISAFVCQIPLPPALKRGQRVVSVPLWLAPKLALSMAMRDEKVNNSELARRLGFHGRVIRRMLRPEHATRPVRIQSALPALRKQITLEIRDAA